MAFAQKSSEHDYGFMDVLRLQPDTESILKLVERRFDTKIAPSIVNSTLKYALRKYTNECVLGDDQFREVAFHKFVEGIRNSSSVNALAQHLFANRVVYPQNCVTIPKAILPLFVALYNPSCFAAWRNNFPSYDINLSTCGFTLDYNVKMFESAVAHGRTRKQTPCVLPAWYNSPSPRFAKFSKKNLSELVQKSTRSSVYYDLLVHVALAVHCENMLDIKKTSSDARILHLISEGWKPTFVPSAMWSNPRSVYHCDGTEWRVPCVSSIQKSLSLYASDQAQAHGIFSSKNGETQSIVGTLFFKAMSLWSTMSSKFTAFFSSCRQYIDESILQIGRNSIDDYILNQAKYLKYFCGLVMLLFGIVLIFIDWKLFTAFLSMVVAYLGVTSSYFQRIVLALANFASCLARKGVTLVKDGNIVNLAFPSFVGAAVYVALSASFGLSVDPLVALAHGEYSMPSWTSLPQGWSAVFSLIEKIFVYASSWFERMFYGFDSVGFDVEQNKIMSEGYKIQEDIVKDIDSFAQNRNSCEAFLRVRAQLVALESGLRNNSKQRNIVMGLRSQLDKHDSALRERGALAFQHADKSTRPATIFIEGPTRIGKSRLVNLLHTDFFNRYNSGFQKIQDAVYRRTTSEFWSDYNCQSIIDFDDFGCMTDSASKPNPNFCDFLNLVSDEPVPLNMAFTKGGVFSRAKLITASLNREQRVSSLVNSEAIHSRKDLHVLVSIDHAKAQEYGLKDYVVAVGTNANPIYTFDERTATREIRYFLTSFHVKYCSDRSYVGRDLNFREFMELYRKVTDERMCPSEHRIKRFSPDDALAAFDNFDPSKFGGKKAANKPKPQKLERDDDYDTEPETRFDLYEQNEEDEISPGPEADALGVTSYIRSMWETLSSVGLSEPTKISHNSGLLSDDEISFFEDEKDGDPDTYTEQLEKRKEILNDFFMYATTASAFVTVIGLVVGAKELFNIAHDWYTQPSPGHGGMSNSSSGPSSKHRSFRSRMFLNNNFGSDQADEPREGRAVVGAFAHSLNLEPKDEYAAQLLAERGDEIDILHKNEDVLDLYAHHVFGILCTSSTGTVLPGSLLSVTGNFVIVNKHVIAEAAKATRVELVNWGSGEQFEINLKQFPYAAKVDLLDDKRRGDLILMSIPELGSKKSIVQHFIPTAQIETTFSALIAAFPLSYYKSMDTVDVKPIYCFGAKVAERPTRVTADGEHFFLSGHLTFARLSEPGNCGTPIVRASRNGAIMGFVSAGNAEESYAQIVPRELLETAIITLRDKDISNMLPEYPGDFKMLEQNHVVADKVNSVMESLGNVESGRPDVKTKLQRTKYSNQLAETFPRIKVPAKMVPYIKNGEKLIPRQAAFAKLLKPQVSLDPADIEKGKIIIEHVINMCPTEVSNRKRVLTPLEAVKRDILPCMNNIDFSSSPGYPWSKKITSKRDLFIFDKTTGEVTGLTQDLQEALNQFVRDVEKRKAPVLAFIDTLKDELRPEAKAERPRLFSVGSVVLLILTRMYFGTYFSALRSNKIRNGIAIGTNVYSKDWQKLMSHITDHTECENPNFICADAADFDASLRASFTKHIFSSIIKWIGDDSKINNDVRWAIANNICYSVHFSLTDAFAWRGGNPSGCPVTAELNSLYSVFAIRFAMEHTLGRPYTFDEVRMCTYGDDQIIGLHPEVTAKFSTEKFAEGFSRIGMTVTNADKSGPPSLIKFDDCEFLKRKFVNREGTIVAPLEQSTITDMVHWNRTRSDAEVFQRVQMSLVEASLHDEQFFKKWQKILVPLVKRHYPLIPQDVKENLQSSYSTFFYQALQQGEQPFADVLRPYWAI
jgi:hypothetical protein